MHTHDNCFHKKIVGTLLSYQEDPFYECLFFFSRKKNRLQSLAHLHNELPFDDNIHELYSISKNTSTVLFVLKFDGPVNPSGSYQVWSFT